MADRATIILLVTILVLVTILLIFAMKYFSAARQARLGVTNEESYRALAETAIKAQQESATALAAMGTGLAGIDARLSSVEKMLKEVG